MSNSKKILVLGNYWPYISGGHRVSPLADHLQDFNYIPLIVSMWKEGTSTPSRRIYPIKNKIAGTG